MLRSVIVAISANRCGAMAFTTNHRVLRKLVMVILPVVLWQNSYKRVILRCNHCQWCFHTWKRFKREMTIIENCALNGVYFVLFHKVLQSVVKHMHNFVKIRDLLARIRNRYVSSWWCVLNAEFGNMSINARCLASTIMTWSLTRSTERNSGYNTLMNDNMCTNHDRDVKMTLKELNILP